MENRQEGYYWVKYSDFWTVGWYTSGRWYMAGFEGSVPENDNRYRMSPTEINENRLWSPEERDAFLKSGGFEMPMVAVNGESSIMDIETFEKLNPNIAAAFFKLFRERE